MQCMSVLIDQLQEGDIIAKDIIDIKTGMVLCYKGQKVTTRLKQNISQIEHTSIEIQTCPWQKVWNIPEGINREYQQNKRIVKSIFENTYQSGKINIDLINDLRTNFCNSRITNKEVVGCIDKIRTMDEYTYTHSLIIGMLSVVLGRWIGLDIKDQENLFIAGTLHDIGKTQIDLALLNKKGPLSNEEFAEIKRHVSYSYELIKDIKNLDQGIIEGVYGHHEKMDGSGYPRGLSGQEIHLYAQIIAITDIYDALTSARAYKSRKTPFEVIENIQTTGIGKLDTKILFIFLNSICHYYVGINVMLSNGDVAEVIFINKNSIHLPIVRSGDKFIDLSKDKSIHIVDIV